MRVNSFSYVSFIDSSTDSVAVGHIAAIPYRRRRRCFRTYILILCTAKKRELIVVEKQLKNRSAILVSVIVFIYFLHLFASDCGQWLQ